MNAIKWGLMAAWIILFLSIDLEPVNASTVSAFKGNSITQVGPVKKHRHNRRWKRKHRRWKRHHKKYFGMNKEKQFPPKNEGKN